MEWSEAAKTCYANYCMNSIPVNKKMDFTKKVFEIGNGIRCVES